MGIETGEGGTGENPNDPKPPHHDQSPGGDPASSDENRPFKLYKDPTSDTNWTLELQVDGKKVVMDYGPHVHRYSRAEHIQRIRETFRITEKGKDQQKPDQGSGSKP